MPVTFRPSEVLELAKYGYFTQQRVWGQSIALAKAVSIAASDIYDPEGVPRPYTKAAPAGEHIINIKKGWGMIIELFDWGDTSRPDKVYYEIWHEGPLVIPQAVEGFHCGAFIGEANLENVSTHPVMANRLILKVWNATGASPEDVWYEFRTAYYTFNRRFYYEVYNLSFGALLGAIKKELDDIEVEIKSTNSLLRELVARSLATTAPLRLG